MSKHLSTAQRGFGRGRKTVAALLLAACLTALPVVAATLPAPVSSFLVPTAQAGCPSGGTCG